MDVLPVRLLDTFARDHLPPADLWPVLEFTTEPACSTPTGSTPPPS